MNADRLLALYDRVTDAPDAIVRLHRFVLDLAVRGKLVEQDPADEPASELLKRIAAEKVRLTRKGEFREPRRAVKTNREELPFTSAGNWGWMRLIEVARISYGFAFKSSRFNTDKLGMPLIRIRDISKTDAEAYFEGEYDPSYVVRSGDYLVGMDGNFNIHRWKGKEALLNQRVMRINGWRCQVNPEFVRVPLQMVLDHLHAGASLSTVKHLSAKQVNGIEIPLPPLAEQRRIVAKIDELMALCDRLEETRTAREDTRDRLSRASLTRLTAPADTDAPTFRAHARFAVNALPALTARADQVKHLRQTILSLAVRGKLVEQDPADEPVPCPDRAIHTNMEPPFPVPSNWRWSRLRALGTLKGGGTPSKARVDFWGGSIPWVSPKEMKRDYIEGAQTQITETALAASAVNVIEPDSVLFVVRGMILAHSFPVAISRVPLTINQDMKAITLKSPEMAEYLLRALKALKPEMLARVQRSSHGTCRIAGADYRDFMVPLPPLAEQRRIVAKVDELMALGEQLEAGLGAADGTRSRLLDSLLHGSLGSHDATINGAIGGVAKVGG